MSSTKKQGSIKKRKKRATIARWVISVITMIAAVALIYINYQKAHSDDETYPTETSSPEADSSAVNEDAVDSNSNSGTVTTAFDIATVPAYSTTPYVEVNQNIPFFSDEEKTRTDAFEIYSELDSLERCGVAFANVCIETMPTEERGNIGSVRPTGWHTVKYNDLIDGNYLYNRCHLIGFQLTGENANELNLITGTRYLNVEGMLPFENEVDDYVEETGNHVLYRVTPIFEDANLVASGVLMEAWSVEDNGSGVCFCVYCYNVQPSIVIDYQTGESYAE